MKDSNDNSSPPHSLDEEIARGALRAGEQHSFADNVCPSDEAMAAFAENTLPRSERDRMMQHIRCCEDCYEHWLLLSDHFEAEGAMDNSKEEYALAQTSSERHPGWTHRLSSWITELLSSTAFPLAVGTATIMAIAIVLMPIETDYQRELDSAYLAALNRMDVDTRATYELPLPWRSGSFGFGLSAETREEQLQFSLGLIEGRDQLVPLSTSESRPEVLHSTRGSHSNVYYQTGRWAALAWTLAESDVERDGWQHVILSGTAIQDAMSEHRNTLARQSIRRLGAAIETIKADTTTPRAKRELRRTLEHLVRDFEMSQAPH